VGDVVEGNIAPVARDDYLSTPAGTTLTITLNDLLGNDEDPDGESPPTIGGLYEMPSHGTLDSDGENTLYIPAPGFVGVDTLKYWLDDGEDYSNIATVYITVGDVAGQV
jgi:hypothetical protein